MRSRVRLFAGMVAALAVGAVVLAWKTGGVPPDYVEAAVLAVAGYLILLLVTQVRDGTEEADASGGGRR